MVNRRLDDVGLCRGEKTRETNFWEKEEDKRGESLQMLEKQFGEAKAAADGS